MSEFEPEKELEISKEKIREFRDKIHTLKEEIHKTIVGQEEVVKQVLVCLICDMHALLEGVPGLAKSLLAETLSRCIEGATFKRIQFVPDMLPSDIIGVTIFDPSTGTFKTVKGPIFANFIIADEVNRAPPKTQSALLEAMQERRVYIYGEEYPLERPFLVLATQNPLEQQGVYPLSEAFVDRFFMKILVDYPSWDEEMEIIDRNTMVQYDVLEKVKKVMTKEDIVEMQRAVRKIYIARPIKEYILRIVQTTRGKGEKIRYLKYIRYGASPRGSISLALAARAIAMMKGRNFVIPDDIKEIIYPVLRHRIILNFEGRAAGISTDEIITEILENVEVP